MRVLPVVCALVYAVAGDNFYEDEYYLRNEDVRLQHSREYRRLINKPPQYENGSFQNCVNATVYKADCNECDCVGGKIYICTLNPCGLNSKLPNGGNNRENLALFSNAHVKSRYNKYVLNTGRNWISKVYAMYSSAHWIDYVKKALKNRNAKVIFYYNTNTNPGQYVNIYKKPKNGKHSNKEKSNKVKICKRDDWVILECMTCLCLEGSLGLCYWNFCKKYGVHKHANIVDHDGDETYDKNKNGGKNINEIDDDQNDKGGKNSNKNKNGGKNNNVINDNQSNESGNNNTENEIEDQNDKGGKNSNQNKKRLKNNNQHNLGSTGK